MHSLATTAPIRCGVPSVITLHDVTFFRHQTFGALTTIGLRVTVSQAARNADVLVTGAASARDEICRVLGLDAAKFVVVPHGHDHQTVSPASEATVRARYDLGAHRLVLCVGAKRPHKNQEVLVRAMRQLGPDTLLVLAGHPEPYDARLRALARDEGVADRVRFVDYVPGDELEALYRMASCAAFPTLSEGFGIPLVEAMQRAVPVAASDIPVLREVGGDVPGSSIQGRPQMLRRPYAMPWRTGPSVREVRHARSNSPGTPRRAALWRLTSARCAGHGSGAPRAESAGFAHEPHLEPIWIGVEWRSGLVVDRPDSRQLIVRNSLDGLELGALGVDLQHIDQLLAFQDLGEHVGNRPTEHLDLIGSGYPDAPVAPGRLNAEIDIPAAICDRNFLQHVARLVACEVGLKTLDVARHRFVHNSARCGCG